MTDRESIRKKLAEARTAAPKLTDPEEIKKRNLAALEKRKSVKGEKKLPEGWRKVESNSRPGEFVYENVNTEERQAWFPDAPASEEAAPQLVAQSADASVKASLKEKNLKALEKRRETMKKQKEEESKLALPEGWIRVESRSRPGEMVYENTVTKERQAWFPTDAAVGGAVDPKKAALMEKNKAALEARRAKLAADKAAETSKPLPEGWRRVESRSRPGEFVYENIHSSERQAWFPETPAEKPLPAGWRKVESRTYPGEFVYENIHTLERQAWIPTDPAPLHETQGTVTAAERTQTGLAAPVPVDVKVIGKCKAVYEYSAGNPEEELDLLEGDIIAIEFKAENGWWVGTNVRTQKTGIFPGSYVEEL
jgi:uncharacterized protein YbdZ (MbtH family)